MNEWVDAEERIERAQQLCECHMWEEALCEVDHALDINPNNAVWLSNKGYLLDQLERHEEALHAYMEALNENPGDRDLLMALGVDYVRTGRLLQAIEAFEAVEKIEPDFETSYCHRIMLYAELGDHERAEEMFYHAQQIDEHCPHCFWHLGTSLWIRNDMTRALYCWQRVLEIEPQYRGARERIAEAYRALGDVDLARDYYLEEYRRNPYLVGLLLEIGDMYLHVQRFDEAISKYRQLIELDPHNARAHMHLGDAFDRRGDDSSALRSYRAATLLDQTMPRLHYRLGSKLVNLGRYSEGLYHFERELMLRPDDRKALLAAGNCSLELGDADGAQVRFEELIALDGALPGAYHNLGVCYFLRGSHEDGIRMCQMALDLKDDYMLARHKLVLANLELGRWKEAKMHLKAALLVQPHSPLFGRLRRRWYLLRLYREARRLAGRLRALVISARNC